MKRVIKSYLISKIPLKVKLIISGSLILIIFTSLIVLGTTSTLTGSIAAISTSLIPPTPSGKLSLDPEVERWRSAVSSELSKYGMEEYTDLTLCIIQIESGGRLPDVMQSSESIGLPPNSITDPIYSIGVGCRYFSSCLSGGQPSDKGDIQGCSISSQGYNFGAAYIIWAKQRGGYTQENAIEYSSMMAKKFSMKSYGDVNYVPKIMRYYQSDKGTQIGDFIYYNQYDNRWANMPYGTDTIAACGCGPTSMAMIVSTFGKQTDPTTMAQWCYEHGLWVKNSGSSHSIAYTVGAAYGFPVHGTNDPNEIVKALQSKKLALALLGGDGAIFKGSGHFIVLRGVDENGNILIGDPASEKNTGRAFSISEVMQNAKKEIWICG